MSRPTQTLALAEHFTDFEDGDNFKQKRARCNYCSTSLAKKNVRRHQAHLINCGLFKQRHPVEWQAFCQYVQTLPTREARPPPTPQQQAQVQLMISEEPTSVAGAIQQQQQQQQMHPFEWQQPHPVAPTSGFRESGFGGNRIGWGIRPALLLVDVCNAYFTPGSPLDISANAIGVPESIRRLILTARNVRIPIAWTQMSYKTGLREAGLFALKVPALSVWEDGDERGLGGWLPGLQPLDNEDVVAKTHPSAFFGTTLSSRLRFIGVDTLIICGASTSGCVRATALDAMCENYRPMIVSTACGDRDPGIHEANMQDMDASMADVVSEEEAIAHIRKGWHF